MKVLAIGCHPDDIEIGCAGTLAKYKKLGHEVTVVHVCNGNLGHVIIEPEELGKMRIEEAKKAGSLAGIPVRTLNIGDLLPYGDNKEQRDMMTTLIAEEQPDVIITHCPNDYMPDHNAVSQLVFDASFAASVPHYPAVQAAGGKPAKVVPIYYMDTVGGVGTVPTEYVDISEFIDLKLEMLNCHESQIKWMLEHDHIDFTEFVRTCAAFRGLQCGVAYAEGFTKCNFWPKVVPGTLLP